MKFGGIKEKDAIKVMDFYMKKKLAKLDPVGGTIKVKHGAYLDKEEIQNTLKELK